MESKIQSLANEMFKIQGYPNPSKDFLEYLYHFATPRKQFLSTSINLPSYILKLASGLTAPEIKLVHFLYKLSTHRIKIREKFVSSALTDPLITEIEASIKKGALGFVVPLFEDAQISMLRSRIPCHLFQIVFDVLQKAQVYKKLKRFDGALSKAQLYFSELVRQELKNYEKAVIECDMRHGLLGFYLMMQEHYTRISVLNQLNECLNDNPKNPFSFLRFYQNNFLCSGEGMLTSEIDEVIKCCSTQTNLLLNEWLYQGIINDVGKEFFIYKNEHMDFWESYAVDYGLVPYFISPDLADKICYVGRCVNLLNEIEKRKNNFIACNYITSQYISILDPNLEELIESLIFEVDEHIKKVFIEGCQLYKHLEYSRKLFLFGREDFIETLFYYLKERGSKISSKRSVSYVLDLALADTFGRLDKFTEKIDVCLLNDSHGLDHISLFCQLDFPLNLILTKEVILKFVKIFKFLWRIKKIEGLLKRVIGFNAYFIPESGGKRPICVSMVEYLTVINKLSYYIKEEVINVHYKRIRSIDGMIVEGLRKGINEILDLILNKIFRGKEKKQIDGFMEALEEMCINIKQGEDVDDRMVRNRFSEFVKVADLENSSIYNLRRYCKVYKETT
ncbi:Gamma-tubulin complex component 3 [Astathelohania contejeani]|uniref:Spindle pole body component n=1 Tax=Astathelohania contejeani TaxID=164912 RepID=A0ABQ7I0P1_9MICR|nr:Gamma-tubulin complex component 3 [Thelohania contejeani]